MTTEMTVVFTLLAIFCAGIMGLAKWRIQTFYVYALIFLNFFWGLWLGSKISKSNEFIWFGTPILTHILIMLIARRFFPKLWALFKDELDLR
jgi:hypothetical protein